MTSQSSSSSTNPASTDLGQLLAEAANRSSHALSKAAERTVEELDYELGVLAAVLGEKNHANGRHKIPRQYADVFRVEFLTLLRPAAASIDSREIVEVLFALEQMARRHEETTSGQFVARLSGSDSVNAVVEIVHDIRSPMSSILFLVDMVRRGQSGPVSPLQERQLGLVYAAALGLSTLASDLIDAVRGERLVDGRPTPFSMTEVILSVCAMVQPIGEEKGLPMHVTFPERDGRVGYPHAINRVLLNLTANALRNTDTGSVSIGCTEDAEQTVEFWVQDTGRGIPDSVMAMLFDGFQPGPAGTRFSSAGLGLAICRTLLEAMDSELKVDTSPEKGTRFSFVIALPAA